LHRETNASRKVFLQIFCLTQAPKERPGPSTKKLVVEHGVPRNNSGGGGKHFKGEGRTTGPYGRTLKTNQGRRFRETA